MFSLSCSLEGAGRESAIVAYRDGRLVPDSKNSSLLKKSRSDGEWSGEDSDGVILGVGWVLVIVIGRARP